MYLWLITQVEDEDMWKTNTGETRANKTRALEDEDQKKDGKSEAAVSGLLRWMKSKW